ncbi:AAA domain-containing protein [Pisolithus orientalis]|uniref:AAA domain-containing protein n=1 Tax=Pisolithus orientalis TaxID=936130 RepID=UPI0022244B31|nr:AAA domain-containing protein [Pisolithus orientalis]KAI6000988.1 AAA domain-containing protein [Pisolithus orientalis]
MSEISPPDPVDGEQTMLILVGLVASGKSTFAEALERHFPRFRRCNQDDLGNRQLVEELAHQTLQEGLSPCIDRTNFNAIQRSYWTNIARSFPRTTISIIVFDTPYHVCASRLQHRTSHPTINDAQQGLVILARFASQFRPPSPDEDYDHILYLKPSDLPSPEYTRDVILSILSRLRASAGQTGRAVQPHISYFATRGPHSISRGGPTRGYRALHGDRGSWRRSSQSRPFYSYWIPGIGSSGSTASSGSHFSARQQLHHQGLIASETRGVQSGLALVTVFRV